LDGDAAGPAAIDAARKETTLVKRPTLALASLLPLVLAASAARPQPPSEDTLAQHVFPPELIMRYAREIALDDRQRATVTEAVRKAQGRFLEVQWELQAESEKMGKLLQAVPVDETAVLAQAERVMDLERQIKKTHLVMLVRLKNLLTDVQKARLQELRGRPAAHQAR
jgi:Spy/CpxP family protein refolding chaperone